MSSLPVQNRLYIATNGCNNLRLDTLITQNALQKAGYILETSPLSANIIIYSACGAREDTEDAALYAIQEILGERANGARFIVTGCLPSIDINSIRERFDHGIEVVPFTELPDYLGITEPFSASQQEELILHQHSGSYLSNDDVLERLSIRDALFEISPSLGRYYESTTPGILFGLEKEPPSQIVISRGCYYRCSYCAIWKGRGDYKSVPLEQIVYKINTSTTSGIALTADESGNYGRDLTPSSNLSELLDAIASKMQEPHKLYLRNLEPYPLDIHYDSLSRLASDSVLYHLCSPLQSASPRILKLMKRNYDPCRALDNLLGLKGKNVLIETHIMTGFPGETEKDFETSMGFIRALQPDNLSVIAYSDRPDTPSIHLPNKIPENVKQERSVRMFELYQSILKERYSKLLLSHPLKENILQRIVLSTKG